MRTHLTEGELRAALDEELTSAQRQHLETCAGCQARMQQMEAVRSETGRLLAFFGPADETEPADRAAARAALARFNQQISQPKENSMTKSWFFQPLVRYGAAALVLLTLILAFPSTRALAGEILKLFRVQQVRVVSVDFTGLEQLTGDGALGNQFTALISDSIDMQQEPGDPAAAASAEDASRLAGFNVRIPAGKTPSQINVTSGAAFNLTLDRARTQALLDQAGRSDLVLPAALDGTEIAVDVPASVSVAFGTCPRPGSGQPGNTEQSTIERRYPNCVILAQIPSPTVNAPADLDIEALARIGLEFTGMSAAEAAEFTGTVDWTSTLLVPIPRNAAVYEQVSVDGVTGTLIQSAGEAPQYALLWVKDGIMYTISGLGPNSQKAVELANALP